MTAKRGVLVRTTPVRLLNVSSSGFLLESGRRLDAGTTGILDVDTGATRYLSPANLVRSVCRPGAGHTFLLGGTFTLEAKAARRPIRLIPRQAARRSLRRDRAPKAPHTSAA